MWSWKNKTYRWRLWGRAGKISPQLHSFLLIFKFSQFNKYPWIVALIDSNGNRWNCGGTLVASKYVITAAHCTFKSKPSDIKVLRLSFKIRIEIQSFDCSDQNRRTWLWGSGWDQSGRDDDRHHRHHQPRGLWWLHLWQRHLHPGAGRGGGPHCLHPSLLGQDVRRLYWKECFGLWWVDNVTTTV